MAIIEDLSDDELYLHAILSDESGLDLAEFTFIDEEKEDACWRAWAFQWKWFRCTDPLQVSCCARSVGKTISITLRAFAFPFIHPGQEMVITAPELVHLEPLAGLIEQRIYSTRLGKMMLNVGRSAVTHRPLQINFKNGARIIGRIPQRDGKGVKGCLGEGTLVLTSSGHVPVEDLKVGDLVLTHKGRWMPIEYMETDVNDCYEVRGSDSRSITVSCDHRFFAAESLDSDLCFIDVEQLEPGYYWATPATIAPSELSFVDLEELQEEFAAIGGTRIGDHFVNEIESVVPVGKRRVYNPIIAEDHSYVANSIVSHNIHPLWLEHDEACFGKDTVILTKRGFLSIDEVCVGDEVWTHLNRWRIVTKVMNKGVRETVLLKGQGFPGIRVTPKHRFWARHAQYERATKWGVKGFDDFDWVPAVDMESVYCSSPVRVGGPGAPEDVPKSKTGSSYPIDTSTPEFMWAMGLYIAEGSLSTRNRNKIDKITWSIHVDEVTEVVERLTSAGIHVFVQPVQSSEKCKNVVCSHVELAQWINRNGFGRGARNKTIPSWVFSLSEENRKAFLSGMVFGDGCDTSDVRYCVGRWRLSTASRKLSVATRLLALGLGYHVSVNVVPVPKGQRFIRGRPIVSGLSYEVVGALRGRLHFDKDYVYARAKKVLDAESTEVFDLEVEEDHSFLADGVFVHNSDYPTPGWTELTETLKRGHEGAVWRAHGVTRGVRDYFYKVSADPNTDWTVHKYCAMWRPTWTDEERQEKVKMYGSRDDPDYRRNILGEHGDATSPIFVLHRLMSCVDDAAESTYNAEEYVQLKINESWLRDAGTTMDDELVLPQSHLEKWKTFWVGMDVGMTSHPSEILVFAEERLGKEEYLRMKKAGKAVPPSLDVPRLKLITRITLVRIGSPDQHIAVRSVIAHYRPRAFAFDSTGLGLPIFQDIQKELEEMPIIKTVVKGYNFSGKILVDFDKTIDIPDDLTTEELVKETGIYRNTVEYATDRLRYIVDNGRLQLPWDTDLIAEFEGQTYKVVKLAMNQYGKKTFSLGKFHALDAARMAVLGWSQYAIEELVKKEEDEPVLDSFMVY